MNVYSVEIPEGSGQFYTVYYNLQGYASGGPTDPFLYLEFSLTCIMLYDYLVRLVTTDAKLRFIFSFYSVVDIAAFFSVAYWSIFVNNLKVSVCVCVCACVCACVRR